MLKYRFLETKHHTFLNDHSSLLPPLVLVHLPVDLGDDGIDIRDGRHAREVAERDADVVRAKRIAQRLDDGNRFLPVGMLDDHEEFVAAHAEDMALTRTLLCPLHDAGHGLDEHIARLVAMHIVHALEAVDIAEDEGARDALGQIGQLK